jgi:hypothetical protein
MLIRPRHHRSAGLIVGLAILVAACGGTTSSASPSATAAPTAPPPSASTAPSTSSSPTAGGDEDAVYDAIEAQVLEIRGLDAVDVARETIDAAELKAINEADFDKDNPPEYIAANERLYKALGLMPEDASLRSTFLELVDSQVAGFYRPDAKKLYVVSRSGTINGADKITFAHEYDHALQDVNFPGVFAEQKELLDQSDQAIARAAVYEGDATILMSLWAIPNLIPAEIQDVIAAGSDPESNEILARTPAILRESLLFPYDAGVTFLTPVQATDGWDGIDAIYADLPRSTEQVIHPEKYQAKEEPVAVTLPATLAADLGEGWSVALEDTFGEFQMRTWLRETGVRDPAATEAAAGWGGDRLAVLDGPGDSWGVVMKTAWDTEADAAAFESAAATAIGAAGGPGGAFVGEGGVTRWVVIGSDDATSEKLTGVLGLAG